MQSKAELYIPQVFRTFQGFEIKDIKEKKKMKLYSNVQY